MIRLILTLSLGLFILFHPLSQVAKADVAKRIETDNNNKIDHQQINEEKSINELLGPEDKFPFLPDNHRDSGTGRIMAFN